MGERARTTVEIAALQALGQSPDEGWVAWAVELLVAGYDSASLRMLAAEGTPVDVSEARRLVDAVFDDLGFAPFGDRESAGLALTSALAQHVLEDSVPVRLALREMADVSLELDLSELLDFWHLHHAFEDLQSQEVQFYWPDVDRSNIEEAVRARCREWLRAHPIPLR